MTPQEAARDAAVFADALARHLLVASCPVATRTEQREAMVGAFRVWPLLCARMSTLEAHAPTCRDEGYAEAQKLREIVDRVEERKAAAA